MSLTCGIVGLPNVGKSTLFNAVTRAGAAVSNYPFCTIDPNVGIVPVPDPRLALVAEIFHSKQAVPATATFVDIAGLVRGASRGEGLGNAFLARIREVDAVAMVVRCFESKEIAHVEGAVDPPRDIDIVNVELALADLAIIDRRLEKTRPRAKTDPKLLPELHALEALRATLDQGKSLRTVQLDPVAAALARELALLTAKPLLYVANADEAALDSPVVQAVRTRAQEEHAGCVVMAAKFEDELAALPPEEAQALAHDLGIERRALDEFVLAGYRLLDLITFLTGRESESRAWTVARGTHAPQAAGKVHSDMERGFIRAEVVSFEDLARLHSWHAARDAGVLRIEGRDYVVQEGDVINFRFHT